MNVLIIEDDKVLALLLSKMVERLDYHVLGTYAKGSDAIDKAQELTPDLVLMFFFMNTPIRPHMSMGIYKSRCNRFTCHVHDLSSIWS